MTFRGNALALTRNGNAWRNTDPIELKGGTLYEISFTAEKVKEVLSLTWETPKRSGMRFRRAGSFRLPSSRPFPVPMSASSRRHRLRRASG